MRESDKLYDEEALNFELPDAALELAGSKGWEGPAYSFTLAFCSGNRHLTFLDPTLIVMKEGPANNRLLFHFAASNRRPRAEAWRL
jgi:hypothetical protein